MDFIGLFLIFIIGGASATFGTLVGGSSLITIPLLIFLGLPPHVAIGTNKLGMSGVTAAGWYKFNKKKLINYKIGMIIATPFFIGSIIGANLVFQVDETVLKQVIAVITFLIAGFIFLKPEAGIKKTKKSQVGVDCV